MADIQEQYDLANDNFFRASLDTGAVLRLATVIALNVDGSLSVDIADEDGSLIDVWPLDGKLFAEGAIIYVLLFHSRGVGLALGVAKAPYPEIDISQIPAAVVLKTGTPTAGRVASWDDANTVEDSGVAVSGLALKTGTPTAGRVASWDDANTVEDSGVAVSGLALKTGTPTAGRVASWDDANAVEDSGVAVSGLALLGEENTFSDPQTFGDDIFVEGNAVVDGYALAAALRLLDSGGDHELIVVSGENLSADRVLAWVLGNADRTVTIPATGTLALLEEDNTFEGVTNIFEGDVDIDGDLTVGGDATVTGVLQASAVLTSTVAWTLSNDFGAGIEYVFSLCAYNGKLYAGLGSSADDGDVYVFDGTTWTLSNDFGAGIEFVSSLCAYNGKLYAGLGTDAGDGDVYVFDGTTWTLSNDFGAGIEFVSSLCVYNGKLYAGLGISAGDGDVWVFDGSTWALSNDFGAGIEYVSSLCAYNGKLYAGLGSSAGDGDVWVFDGATWALSNDFGAGIEFVYSLCAYNGKLYAGLGSSAGDGDVWVFDGTTWALSNDFGAGIEFVRTLCVYNGKLYAGLGISAGDGDVWVFDGSTWALSNDFGAGVERVQSLCVYNGKLYAGLGISAGDGDVWVYSEPLESQLEQEFRGGRRTPFQEQPHAFAQKVELLDNVIVPQTITTVGTTGNQTINKLAGRVNIAAAGTAVTVTNSFVTANSIVIAVPATADTTARVTSVVPGAGSFVINTVAVTAETAFSFLVIN